MDTPDRLGELRMRLIPHVISHLAQTDTAATSAELSVRALQRFDGALTQARVWHQEHADEDPDVHLAHLMQLFCDSTGIPHLSCLSVIERFVLDEPKTKTPPS